MNPFVRGGGGPGGPAAAHAQRGARQWAKQWSNSPLPELPPSALAGDRATRRQGKKGPVQACGPELPPSRKTGGVQATSRRRTQNQAAAKASNGTVMHARTPTPGRSRDVRATRRRARLSKSSTIEGGREMRLMGGDGLSRKLFASMAPEGPGNNNNNDMVVVGAVGRVGLAPSESKASSPMRVVGL